MWLVKSKIEGIFENTRELTFNFTQLMRLPIHIANFFLFFGPCFPPFLRLTFALVAQTTSSFMATRLKPTG